MKHLTKLIRPGEEVIVPSQEVLDQIHKGSVVNIPTLAGIIEARELSEFIPHGDFRIHVN